MEYKQKDFVNELLLLIDEKTDLLRTLKKSLEWFCANMNDADSEKILQELDTQTLILEQIQIIDQKIYMYAVTLSLPFNPARSLAMVEFNDRSPQWYLLLEEKLQEQFKILSVLAPLNQTATSKAQSLASTLKEKVKLTRQKNQILSNYQLLNTHQTGNFFNFKEG